MQRSPNPLFHYKTLEKRMLSFGFPKNLSDRLPKINKWVSYSQSENLPDPLSDAEFLHDLCVDVLGYRSPFTANAKTWELEFTPTPALGFFDITTNHVLIEILIGDIRIKPQPNYATTEWVIVTDYQYIRLYASHRMQIFYEQFNFADLITNEQYLKQFYFLLCRRTLLGANYQDQSRLSKLLIESEELIQEFINSFYSQYHKIRSQLIKDFSYRLQLINATDDSLNLEQPEVELTAIAKAQKLLNRIIFIMHCQDHKLLPEQLIINAYEFSNPYIYQPIWSNYKALFSWISKGNTQQSVFGYGGSLFAHDPVLDEQLFVGDELCRQIKDLSRFDFYDDISNLAIAYILKELNKDSDVIKKQSITKRKKLKYPSKILVNYESICELIKVYLNKQAESKDIQNTLNPEYWTNRKSALESLKIYDPECRSGIFLVLALSILIEEYHQIYSFLDLKYSDDLTNQILLNQIYGCDRNSESVEITKLNLWLHSINVNQTLTNLDQNIQLGNNPDFQEVINSAQVAGNLVILK